MTKTKRKTKQPRLTEEEVDRIASEVACQFPGFGNGRNSPWGNPLAEALKDRAATFALGVPVREVVLATLKAYRERTAQ